ncbi:MAG: type II toxin-antitoxin system RelE family toxin [Chlamydiales bacterium]
MKYNIQIPRKIAKKLLRFPKKDQEKIVEKIDLLKENPKPDGYKKLSGHNDPLLYRIRVGDYRIVYTVEEDCLIILIVEVGHRKDIYHCL